MGSASSKNLEGGKMTREEMLKRLKKGEDPLELSIQKWQDIVDGKGKDEKAANCALCRVYCRTSYCQISRNEKCPVGNCSSTPYINYANASNEEDKLKYAKEELLFLKSLRKNKEDV